MKGRETTNGRVNLAVRPGARRKQRDDGCRFSLASPHFLIETQWTVKIKRTSGDFNDYEAVAVNGTNDNQTMALN